MRAYPCTRVEKHAARRMLTAFLAAAALHGLILLPLCKSFKSARSLRLTEAMSPVIVTLVEEPPGPSGAEESASSLIAPSYEDIEPTLPPPPPPPTDAKPAATPPAPTVAVPEPTTSKVTASKKRKPKPQVSPPQPVNEKLPPQAAPPVEEHIRTEGAGVEDRPSAPEANGGTGPDGRLTAGGVPSGYAALSPRPIEGTGKGGHAAPVCIHRAQPAYPDWARQRGWEGTVLVEALISSTGTVSEIRILWGSGHALLDEAARDAVRDWRFKPGKKDGVNTSAWVHIPVSFQLR